MKKTDVTTEHFKRREVYCLLISFLILRNVSNNLPVKTQLQNEKAKMTRQFQGKTLGKMFELWYHIQTYFL